MHHFVLCSEFQRQKWLGIPSEERSSSKEPCWQRVFQIHPSRPCQERHLGHDGAVWFDCKVLVLSTWCQVLCASPTRIITEKPLWNETINLWSVSFVSQLLEWFCPSRYFLSTRVTLYSLVLWAWVQAAAYPILQWCQVLYREDLFLSLNSLLQEKVHQDRLKTDKTSPWITIVWKRRSTSSCEKASWTVVERSVRWAALAEESEVRILCCVPVLPGGGKELRQTRPDLLRSWRLLMSS